jgi:hypothetical protein
MIIRLRRYVKRITYPDGDISKPEVTNELVLDKGLRVQTVPRVGEYVGYRRYENGKLFMVKHVGHTIDQARPGDTDHDIVVEID